MAQENLKDKQNIRDKFKMTSRISKTIILKAPALDTTKILKEHNPEKFTKEIIVKEKNGSDSDSDDSKYRIKLFKDESE